MKLYRYDESKKYIGTESAYLDPEESRMKGMKVYLIPTDATTVEPPEFDLETENVFFIKGKWQKSMKEKQDERRLKDSQMYDELSIQYIHEKYSYDEENKIMREYLPDMTNEQCKVAFDTYNTYVEECKIRAYTEVYGN